MIFPAWKKHELIISGVVSFVFFTGSILLISIYLRTLDELTDPPTVQAHIQGVSDHRSVSLNTPTLTPSVPPTITITKKPSPTITPTHIPTQTLTITVTPLPKAQDTSGDILTALNAYRQQHGISPVSIDQTLQTFAQSRAELFDSAGSMDNHAGFQSMLNENGFEQMGFNALGENSSFGEWGTPQNLIESIYASSPAHNESQLKADWTHVGIGTKGHATNIVFGGKKR